MLQRVLTRLLEAGFSKVAINVHHFADQIVDFVRDNDFGLDIRINDESGELLDTGGGLARAAELFDGWGSGPVLVHNADILSDAPLAELIRVNAGRQDGVTLLTSARDSSRKLLFDREGNLRGWHNLTSGGYRPAAVAGVADELEEHAFSGIYVLGENALEDIKNYGHRNGIRKFPVMDYFLSFPEGISIREVYKPGLELIDIGKPDTLRRANLSFGSYS